MEKKEKVGFKDLNIWLKIPIILMWIWIGIFSVSFIVGFFVGILGG